MKWSYCVEVSIADMVPVAYIMLSGFGDAVDHDVLRDAVSQIYPTCRYIEPIACWLGEEVVWTTPSWDTHVIVQAEATAVQLRVSPEMVW